MDHIHSENIETDEVTKNYIKEMKSSSLADGLRQDSTLLLNFVLMILIWSIMSITYYIFQFQLKNQGENFIFNIFAIGIAELLSVMLARFLFYVYGFKKVFLLTQVVCMIGGCGLILIYEGNSDQSRHNNELT